MQENLSLNEDQTPPSPRKEKRNRTIAFAVLAILLVVAIAFFGLRTAFLLSPIDDYEWSMQMVYAYKPYYRVVAHTPEVDFSDDTTNIFAYAKKVDLVCTAQNGILQITDKTNEKTYEGTYIYEGYSRYHMGFRNYYEVIYRVEMEGLEGSASVRSRMLHGGSVNEMYLNFDEYQLYFEGDGLHIFS